MNPGSARSPSQEDPARVRARDLLAQARSADPLYAPRGELTYSVEQELGRGGAAVVHLVTDQRLGRQAALKLLHAPQPARVRRFRREAELTARLDHPGVPPVYAAGSTTAGQPYMVMRYVRGQSLGQALQALDRNPAGAHGPEPRILLDALVKVAETVAYAHSRGVVHRDLKPDNVMLGDFGEVLVVDWGLARDRRESAQQDAALREDLGAPQDARLTREGAAIGTLGYMAPEQAQGEDVGPPADVFALGGILTEILTGLPPFAGASADELLVWTCLGQLQTPRDRRPDVAPELDSIARQALAVDPRRRYPDARAFAQDLRAYLDGSRVEAHRYSPIARARLWARRRPVLAAAVITAATVLTSALPVVYRADAEGGAAQRSELIQTARAEYLSQRDTLEQDPSAGQVGQALAALSAAQRWYGLAPHDPDATQARVSAALQLGEVASRTRQWTLATTAVRSVEGLGHDDEVGAAAEAIREASEARARERTERVTRLLAEAKSGVMHARPKGLRHAMYQLARDADPTTVETLRRRLDQVSSQLEAVLRGAWQEAVHPTPEEFELGARELDGLEQALARLNQRVPGDRQALLTEQVVVEAARRILRRARGPDATAFSPIDARAAVLPLIGTRQLKTIGAGPLRVAELCVKALSRLEPSPASQEALLRYLHAEADQVRAFTVARALARIGDAEALRVLRQATVRYGSNRPFDMLVGPLLAKRPDVVWQLEGRATLDEVFDHGQLLMDRGDWAGAVEDFSLVLRTDPNNGGAYGNRGLARFQLGLADEALADLSRAIEIQPGDAALLVNRGQVLRDLGRQSEAESDLRQAVQHEPKNAQALNALGLLVRKQGQVDEALALFSRSIEADPALTNAWANRARTLANMGRFEEAIADMQRVLDLHPDSASLYGSLGSIHLDRGDMAEVRLASQRALELDPNEPTALGLRGLVLLDEARFDDAYRALTRALEFAKPSDRVSHLANRANCSMQMNRHQLALEDVRAALKLDPTVVQLWWMRGHIALAIPQVDEALAAGARSIELAPNVSRGWLVRGNARMVQGDVSGARQDLVQAARLDPSDTSSRLLLGFAVLLSGDEAGAEKLFAAVEPSQYYAAVWLTALGGESAQLERVAGRLDIVGHLARHYLGQVSADELPGLAENSPEPRRAWARCEVQTHLGLAALRRKQREQAADHFRQALKTKEIASNAYMVARWLLAKLEGRE